MSTRHIKAQELASFELRLRGRYGTDVPFVTEISCRPWYAWFDAAHGMAMTRLQDYRRMLNRFISAANAAPSRRLIHGMVGRSVENPDERNA
jgi:hypothetical protein